MSGGTRIEAYLDWLRRTGRVNARDYDDLWRWSTSRLEEFWASVWDFHDIRPRRRGGEVLTGSMPWARWFPDEHVNYADNVFRHDPHSIALHCLAEDGEAATFTRGELGDLARRLAAALRGFGVREGDHIAAVLPNRVEAVVAFLAAARIGAVWTLCSPEFGVSSILARLGQVAPVVVFTTDAYQYGGKTHDVRARMAEVVAGLPAEATHVVVRSGLVADPVPASGRVVDWDEALRCEPEAGDATQVSFNHPLWVLFSSGTTGVPKAFVHGHGGIVLEHTKSLSLHFDVGPDDVFFWYTSTAWMMWNFVVGSLLVGATAVMYDGKPAPERLWPLVDRLGLTFFGASPGFFAATRDNAPDLVRTGALRTVGSTGSPLSASLHEWLQERLGPAVRVAPVSGGTDVCSGFVGPSPLLSDTAGEMQCRMLGVACAAYDDDGNPVVDSLGELVVEKPMPSMPLRFLNDASGEAYRRSYFDMFPGVWRHGDWVTITKRGSAIVHGRSDATLNRGGVRMGTSDFYRALEAVDGVNDSLVIDVQPPGEEHSYLLLFVVCSGELTPERADAIKSLIASEVSPRHRPDLVIQVSDIPRTITGKKVEVPVKRALMGHDIAAVAQLDALENPQAFADLVHKAVRAARQAGIELVPDVPQTQTTTAREG